MTVTIIPHIGLQESKIIEKYRVAISEVPKNYKGLQLGCGCKNKMTKCNTVAELFYLNVVRGLQFLKV